jgi:CTP-dependent riboflavin kinase
MQLLRGHVESGEGDASRWLGEFNEAYARKVGTAVFPGSLNVRLVEPFDWFNPEISSAVIQFAQEEYGGERDVLMMSCSLRGLDHQDAHLWSTVNAARDQTRRTVVEVIAPVNLRERYGLVDGDYLEIELA